MNMKDLIVWNLQLLLVRRFMHNSSNRLIQFQTLASQPLPWTTKNFNPGCIYTRAMMIARSLTRCRQGHQEHFVSILDSFHLLLPALHDQECSTRTWTALMGWMLVLWILDFHPILNAFKGRSLTSKDSQMKLMRLWQTAAITTMISWVQSKLTQK